MVRADGDGPSDPSNSVHNAWLRFGVVAAVGSLLFTGFLLYLLRIDPTLALVVAVVGSSVAGMLVMLLASYRPDGETLVGRWFGGGRDR